MKLIPGQLRQNAAAMIAFADGKPVEALNFEYSHHGYKACDPLWNFNEYLYRPKPAPVSRPWSKPDDVPGPVCWIRLGGHALSCVIIGISKLGIATYLNPHGLDWSVLRQWEYSTDRKTWHKCEVTE